MGDGVVRDRPVYQFHDVRVDLGRMAELRGDRAIPLEPKAVDVLVYLIEDRDRVVTKDELLDAVWTGTFVTPNVLSRAVAQIRKALGDESQDARYIETVAKRGYRFIAPVTVVASAGEPVVRSEPIAQGANRTSRGAWHAVVVLAVLAIAALAVSLVVYRQRVAAAHPDTADLHLKRLTNRRGFTGTPAVAPDGHAVVYSSDATGSLELYFVNLVQGSGEVALTKDGGHNMQPSWSPDGQWIAFHSRRRGGVWIIPSSGGARRLPFRIGSRGADSRTIVFTSDARTGRSRRSGRSVATAPIGAP